MTKIPQNIEEQYITPLGTIKCGFNLYNPQHFESEHFKYENGFSTKLKNDSIILEKIFFKLKQPLENGGKMEDGFGWIFRIEKISDIIETKNIETYCLIDNYENVEFDSSCGENLDAIEVRNVDWILNIGTEDGEIMNFRAEKEDWFPKRLKEKVSFYKSITEMKENGFRTKIPNLESGEKIHIQYLIAYNKKENNNVNSWIAVEESKRNLENWIGIW